jgi:hypothetical protein
MLIRKRLRQWGVVWIAITLFGLAVLALQYRRMSEERARSMTLAEQVRPLFAIREATGGYAQQARALDEKAGSLRTLQTPDRSLALLAILSDAAKPTGRQLQIQQLSLKAASRHAAPVKTPRGAKPAAEAAAQPATVALRGIATSDLILARFVDALRSSGAFDDVELTSFTQTRTHGAALCQFQVECRFSER